MLGKGRPGGRDFVYLRSPRRVGPPFSSTWVSASRWTTLAHQRDRMKCMQLISVIPPDYPTGPFIADMTKPRHQTLNQLLNTAADSSRSFPAPIRFSRAQHTDSFYTLDRGPKMRVSRDRQGNVVESIVKSRLGDMNVYSPQEALDWRISVSTEEPGMFCAFAWSGSD